MDTDLGKVKNRRTLGGKALSLVRWTLALSPVLVLLGIYLLVTWVLLSTGELPVPYRSDPHSYVGGIPADLTKLMMIFVVPFAPVAILACMAVERTWDLSSLVAYLLSLAAWCVLMELNLFNTLDWFWA